MILDMKKVNEMLPKLSECSHIIDMEGNTVTDESPSQYVMRYVFDSMIGKEFTESEFNKAIENALHQEDLKKLIDEGLLEVMWGPDGECYKLTEDGIRRAEEDAKEE